MNDYERFNDVLPDNLLDGILTDSDIIELVMDIGRVPLLRYASSGDLPIRDEPVTYENIEYVLSKIPQIGKKLRTGIPGTLHRVSAIRGIDGHIIGLTLRYGRYIENIPKNISQVVKHAFATLLIGYPGSGKTTLLRTLANELAQNKRVIVVDTTMEIGGYDTVPHYSIGDARRIPVLTNLADTLIEACENHTPQVIVVDEISNEKDVLAVRSIAERGVQMVASAHGDNLYTLIRNPVLNELIGGIASVTLGDDTARYRGCQKTVQERTRPSTFDAIVEFQGFAKHHVWQNVEEAVDDYLNIV